MVWVFDNNCCLIQAALPAVSFGGGQVSTRDGSDNTHHFLKPSFMSVRTSEPDFDATCPYALHHTLVEVHRIFGDMPSFLTFLRSRGIGKLSLWLYPCALDNTSHQRYACPGSLRYWLFPTPPHQWRHKEVSSPFSIYSLKTIFSSLHKIKQCLKLPFGFFLHALQDYWVFHSWKINWLFLMMKP